MRNRPDYRSYLKYHYRKILGTAYESQTITCRSGKVYAVVKGTMYKALRILLLGAGMFFLLMPRESYTFYSLIVCGTYFAYIAVLKLLKYFFVKYEELDDTNELNLERASIINRPPLWDYIKSKFSSESEVLIYEDFEDEYGQKFRERSNIDGRVVLFLILSICLFIGLSQSVISNIAIFLVLIILYLVISPLRYFLTDFDKIDNNAAAISKVSDDKQQRSLRGKITGAVSFLFIAAFIIIALFVDSDPILDSFITRTESGISMQAQTTFEEAYQLAHAYADEQCGDAELLRFTIIFDGEDAIKTRQPTYWELDFQDPPTGLFSDPNQTMHIVKSSDTLMSAYHIIPEIKVSMKNAPTVPINVHEILTILETDLGVSFEDTTAIKIKGGVQKYKQLPRNTFEVQTDKHHYIVDVVNKTAGKK